MNTLITDILFVVAVVTLYGFLVVWLVGAFKDIFVPDTREFLLRRKTVRELRMMALTLCKKENRAYSWVQFAKKDSLVNYIVYNFAPEIKN